MNPAYTRWPALPKSCLCAIGSRGDAAPCDAPQRVARSLVPAGTHLEHEYIVTDGGHVVGSRPIPKGDR